MGKMTAKQLERSSKKCEKNEKKERKLIKTCITKGRPENARIHAENAIREKNQAVNFLRLSARVDAVSQRVQTAVTMQKVTQGMKGVVKGMDKAMASMNLVQMTQLMDKFESQFEDLDVQISVMDQAMSSTSVQSTPEGEVNSLMHKGWRLQHRCRALSQSHSRTTSQKGWQGFVATQIKEKNRNITIARDD